MTTACKTQREFEIARVRLVEEIRRVVENSFSFVMHYIGTCARALCSSLEIQDFNNCFKL
jgi:hypothetical protein